MSNNSTKRPLNLTESNNNNSNNNNSSSNNNTTKRVKTTMQCLGVKKLITNELSNWTDHIKCHGCGIVSNSVVQFQCDYHHDTLITCLKCLFQWISQNLVSTRHNLNRNFSLEMKHCCMSVAPGRAITNFSFIKNLKPLNYAQVALIQLSQAANQDKLYQFIAKSDDKNHHNNNNNSNSNNNITSVTIHEEKLSDSPLHKCYCGSGPEFKSTALVTESIIKCIEAHFIDFDHIFRCNDCNEICGSQKVLARHARFHGMEKAVKTMKSALSSAEDFDNIWKETNARLSNNNNNFNSDTKQVIVIDEPPNSTQPLPKKSDDGSSSSFELSQPRQPSNEISMSLVYEPPYSQPQEY